MTIMMTASPERMQLNTFTCLNTRSSYALSELQRFDVSVGTLASAVEANQAKRVEVSQVDGKMLFEPAEVPMNGKAKTVSSGDTPPRAARGKHLRVLALLNNAHRKGMNRVQSVPALSTLEAFEPAPFGACGSAELSPDPVEADGQKMVGIETHFRRAVGLRSEPMAAAAQATQAPVLAPAPAGGFAGWGPGCKRGRAGGDWDAAETEVKKHRGWEMDYWQRSKKAFNFGNWEQHYSGETQMDDSTQQGQGGHMETCFMEAVLPQMQALPQMVSMVS